MFRIVFHFFLAENKICYVNPVSYTHLTLADEL